MCMHVCVFMGCECSNRSQMESQMPCDAATGVNAGEQESVGSLVMNKTVTRRKEVDGSPRASLCV